jgi:hypothetical protein
MARDAQGRSALRGRRFLPSFLRLVEDLPIDPRIDRGACQGKSSIVSIPRIASSSAGPASSAVLGTHESALVGLTTG